METGLGEGQGRGVSPVGGAGRGRWNELAQVLQNRTKSDLKHLDQTSSTPDANVAISPK